MIGSPLDSLRKIFDTADQLTIITQDLAILCNSLSDKALDITLDHFPNSLTGLVFDQASIRYR